MELMRLAPAAAGQRRAPQHQIGPPALQRRRLLTCFAVFGRRSTSRVMSVSLPDIIATPMRNGMCDQPRPQPNAHLVILARRLFETGFIDHSFANRKGKGKCGSLR